MMTVGDRGKLAICAVEKIVEGDTLSAQNSQFIADIRLYVPV